MNSELRVALVGAGRAGMVHARNFASGVRGARLVAVADPDEQALAAAASELGVDRTFTDAIEAAGADGIDAVVIAAPTFIHADVAVRALEADKHVLCEKPISSTLEEAARIVRAADRSTGQFLMAFMRRFDAGFVRAAERIAAGDIGERHPGFVDVLAATFELSEGAIAQVDGACPAGYGYDARVEVYGSEGTLLVGGPTARTALLVRSDGAVTDPVRSWRTLFADAYREENRHFVAVARGEEEPRTGVLDGVQALATVLATNRSIATGVPVTLAQVRPA